MYTGRGRDIIEMGAIVAPDAQDFGDQLRCVREAVHGGGL
jgi:hypothetical protein